ncbi:glycoside hydrolase superfamily [Favolaschia claudopus]|uniref:cellulase n=1 Tax=Favolaschia claudopus TaxID=2862362 RepID=A0AAW0CBT0_9AGAR
MSHCLTFALAVLAATISSACAQGAVYSQCGGQGWSGATTCVSGAVCTVVNDYYSQCLPGTATSTVGTTTTSATGSSPTGSAGSLKFTGVNIAGFDFGCGTDGTCNTTQAWPPLAQYGGNDGQSQMQHFVQNDGFNMFRLPVGWQWLVNNQLGGALNSANLAEYDSLVQACLGTGAYCIIDIHNYARWNGAIIGQGGPTNAQFASVWSALASKYASQSKILFGVMNEPHDVPSITTWATSVQAAVTAIRQAGATSQMILLPGNDWTSAGSFVSDGSAAALSTVKNPDGSTTNLIFDVHKYLDSDNSGTHAECTTNNIDSAWTPLVQWLRTNKRQALNTETGGGNTASCVQFMCQQIAFQAQNSDVILGYVGWSAGNFNSTYVLSEVPNGSSDTSLVSSCLSPKAGAQSGST